MPRPWSLLKVLLLSILLWPTTLSAQGMRTPWARDQGGFLRHWLVLGELPNADHKGLDTDFLAALGGEASVRPVAGMKGKRPDGSEVVWREIDSDANIVDLMPVFAGRPVTNVAAYAYAVIERAQAGKMIFAMGSDDGIAVWLNGRRVHINRVARGLTADEDQVEVDLVAGTNHVLLKVDQQEGAWSFCFRAFEVSDVRVPPALSASLNVEGGTLQVRTNPGAPGSTALFEAMSAGGKAVAKTKAPRGQAARFDTATWPTGPYDVRVTVNDWQGVPERVYLSWYKGDVVAALKSLAASAPKPPFASPQAGHLAMLAEMALDRAQGHLDAVPAGALSAEYRILMESEELKRGNAVHGSGFVRLAYEDDVDGSVQFCRAYLPAAYDAAKPWPLVLNLHGYNPENPAYVRWWSVDERHAGIADRRNVIWVEPHGRGNTMYLGMGDRDVLRCLELAKQRFRVDADRVYLTGQSMGGAGTWNVASRHPELFAAIAPVFGAFDYHVDSPDTTIAGFSPRERYFRETRSSFVQAESLNNTPIYVNHGDADPVVDVNHSRYGVRMLQRWGYDVRYFEHPGKGHGGMGNDDEMVAWMLRHRRNPNPRLVRVRAASLRNASSFWLTVEHREKENHLMVAEAEVVGTNAIRLDSDNVMAITLSPPKPLVDPAKPLRVSWNGRPSRTLSLVDGRATLYAEGQQPHAGEKTAAVSGPIAALSDGPFAIVVGTISPDSGMREAIQRKLGDFVDGWAQRQHQPLRWFKDTEMSDAQIARHSLLLLGDASANAVSQRLGTSLPIRLQGDQITLAGRTFNAADGLAVAYSPNPLNPRRGVVMAAATSATGMALLPFDDERLTSYDFFIIDSAVANPVRGRSDEEVRVAAGMFDRDWRIDEGTLEQGKPAVRAKCPRLSVRGGALVPATPLGPAEIAMIAGRYQSPRGAIDVFLDGERLLVKFPYSSPLLMVPEGGHVFAAGNCDLGFEVKDGQSQAVNVRLPGQPAPVRAPRVSSPGAARR